MDDRYEYVVRRWYNKVRPLFFNMLRSRYPLLSLDDIEDIYQDAFMAVHDNIVKGRVATDTSWSAYIIKIGMNMAEKRMHGISKTTSIDIFEQKGPIKVLKPSKDVAQTPIVDGDNDADRYTSEKAHSVLGRVLEYIPEPCCTIIKLFYYGGMSMKDIADAVNYKNATTAKSKKSQCMRTLTKHVKGAFEHAGIE